MAELQTDETPKKPVRSGFPIALASLLCTGVAAVLSCYYQQVHWARNPPIPRFFVNMGCDRFEFLSLLEVIFLPLGLAGIILAFTCFFFRPWWLGLLCLFTALIAASTTFITM